MFSCQGVVSVCVCGCVFVCLFACVLRVFACLCVLVCACVFVPACVCMCLCASVCALVGSVCVCLMHRIGVPLVSFLLLFMMAGQRLPCTVCYLGSYTAATHKPTLNNRNATLNKPSANPNPELTLNPPRKLPYAHLETGLKRTLNRS